MTINDKYYVQKKEFVVKLSEALNLAKPHLTCEFKLGEELPPVQIYTDDGCVERQLCGEYVIVTAKNGYQYRLDVTASSLAVIGMEVFREMVGK